MISAHCFHHPERESVARCPSCRRCFCRECITEHDGRVICARCLAALLAPPAATAARREWMTAPVVLATGVLSAWIVFYALGWILLHIPEDLHDGSRWVPTEAQG